MIVVIGRGRCSEEDRDELIAAMREMQDASRREEGCIRYGFYTAVEDPLSFVAVEEWSDRAALDKHFQEEHLQRFSALLGRFVTGQPEVAIHEVADTGAYPG